MPARERWRKVRRADGYKVSSLGRVRSVDRVLSDGRQAAGQMLEQFPDKDGYLFVTISGEKVPVSHIVLEAFHGPRPYGTEACHGPNGVSDNAEDQLRWDSRRENLRDKLRDRRDRGEGRDGNGGAVSHPEVVVTAVTGDQQR